MTRAAAALALLALFGCAAPETSRNVAPDIVLPPMKTFPQVKPTPPRLSNALIARDFLDLTFLLENGDAMPVFARFEGPITVAVGPGAPPTLDADLDRLLARLRSEANIPIRRARPGATASITVHPVTRRQIQRVAPSAACFVRPNVSDWDDYRKRRNDPATYWNRLSLRRTMAVFLPNDVSPQEVRDCLHEEIAQALGPVNDLYRLNESIFNDDNFHTVLTGFDMLILRVFYDSSLRSGMSRAEVAARLPAILARLNPSGGVGPVAAPEPPDTDWARAMTEATTPGTSRTRRRAAAERALDLAKRGGARDSRLALSYYILGRLSLATDPNLALNAFLQAGKIYQSRPDTAIQEAHIALQIAAFQLSGGHADVAIALVDSNLPIVRQSEHAALLSLLLMVKAEALEVEGRSNEARDVQSEAFAWARYGFGDEKEIRDRAAEILAISPRSREGDAV